MTVCQLRLPTKSNLSSLTARKTKGKLAKQPTAMHLLYCNVRQLSSLLIVLLYAATTVIQGRTAGQFTFLFFNSLHCFFFSKINIATLPALPMVNFCRLVYTMSKSLPANSSHSLWNFRKVPTAQGPKTLSQTFFTLWKW